ncbi:DUF6538 domain-containing protein [Pseudomonas guineae]|uniref:DUF6538 domain-containing protein n=1 Tax=Pseudomonas guineae TaxID=425504 RepID=UPI003CFE6E6B
MTVMAQPWKHPVSGVFYFRREVPEDIRGLIGKREWKLSLKTKELVQARPRFAHESAKCEQVFLNAREQQAGRSVLLHSDVHKLADRWSAEVIAEWEADEEAPKDFLVVQGDEVSTALDFVDVEDLDSCFRAVEVYIRSALEKVLLPLPNRADPVWERLVHEFYRAWRDLCRIAFSRYEGDWRDMPVLEAATQRLFHETKAASLASSVPRLSQVFSNWSEDKLQNDGDTRSARKTIGEFGSAVTRFIELHRDLPVDQITRVVCRDFRSNLFKIPTKGQGIRCLTAPALIEKAATEGLPTAELATVNKQLRALSAVLGFAHQVLGVIHENPIVASGLIQRSKKAERKQGSSEDKGYTLEELRQIFASPLFRGQWKPAQADFGQALYWMPLIMAYSGVRREELAQLLVADVKQEGGVWFLDLQEGEGQSLKTLSSRRQVPLHGDLLELGFIEYLHTVPSGGRAFPKLTMHAANGYGHGFGRMWSKYLDKVVGLRSGASPAHGFRHSFKTLCRESQIPGEIHDWITGHSSGSVGDKYGRNPIGRMALELKKYPSIARMAGLLP